MDTSLSILQKVRFSLENCEPFTFWIKRDDLIDPIVSGNKWRKLKYNVEKAQHQKSKGILTFGGAFSNHLIATAEACQIHGLKSVGIVRGDELTKESNDTLSMCAEYGMDLRFVSRSDYKKRNENDYLYQLRDQFSQFYIVPEGGANFYGAIGCQEILQETPNNFDRVYLAGGTGTTAVGVLSGVPENTKVHLVSALKGDFLADEVLKGLQKLFYNEAESVSSYKQLVLSTDHHFGGYGKVNQELLDFINDFYKQTEIPLDPIYTGKAMYALMQDYKDGMISQDETCLFIHTGGLQGAKKWRNELLFVSS
jgi:1-aminocyclopropane-1-carboxylate deaminase